jgi:hypothetical protein
VQGFEGLCNAGIILPFGVNCHLQIVAAASIARDRGTQMNIKRVFVMWWVAFSILFIAFVAVLHSNGLREEFERASAQQQWVFERTKEKAAPMRSLFRLSAVATGVPLGLLAIGLALIWASGVTTRQGPNGIATES